MTLQCEAIAPASTYQDEHRCAQRRQVKPVRWAPTPLTTKIRRLCPWHKAVVERRGDVVTIARTR